MTERIKELREKLFKTQTIFADVLGLTPPAIGDYERGKSFLKPEKIAYLIENYNVNANWLLAGKGQMLIDSNESSDMQQLKKENEKLKIENALLKELINNQNNR